MAACLLDSWVLKCCCTTPVRKKLDTAGACGLHGSIAASGESKTSDWKIMLSLLISPGEPFSQEEMEEMLSAAIDPESNTINYRDYITMMVIDEN